MAMKRYTTFILALLIIMVMLTLFSTRAMASSSDAAVTTASSLNVRSSPSIGSNVIGSLEKGSRVEIIETISTSDSNYPIWIGIRYYGQTGYVYSDYLADSISINTNYTGIVTANGGLNLRSRASTNSSVINTLQTNTAVHVSEIVYTSDSLNTTWLKVTWNNYVGYVSKVYIIPKDEQNDFSKEDSQTNSVQNGVVRTALNLRSEPTTDSNIKEVLNKGYRVDILDSTNTSNSYGKWYKIRSPSGNTGWVASQYLNVVGEWSLISTATTRTSPQKNRDYNIALASSLINGKIISSGSTFSWFETVGQCSSSRGFLPATIFVDGQTTQGYGGGVCQVSTTINMAVKKAGIKTNATQHSLPVTYASREDEATVAYPYINFSFKNTLEQKIKLEVFASNGICTCNVYVAG